MGAVQFTSVPQPAPDTVTVSADFSDVDTTDTHSFSVDTSGTQGEVTNNGDGTFTYSANGAFEHLAEGETSTDSFTYTVDDGNGGTSTETATITITGQNDAPAAAAIDAGTVDEDGGSQTIDLLASATDIDGDNLSVSGISVVDDMGVALSFTDNGDGTISIDPIQYGEDLGQGESRVVTISYDIDDGTTTVSNTATMTVTGVTNNIAPTAQDTAVAPEGAGFVFDENPVVTSQQVSTTDQYQSGSYQYDANSDYNPSVIAFGDGGYAVAWREIDAEYSGTTRTSQTDQIAVQIYGADDQPVGAKMLFGEIDTSNSGDTDVDRAYEYNPRMVSMSDGGFAMTWEGDYRSYTGTSQTQYERDIYVQIFDASGAPTSSDPIKVSQTVPAANGSTTAYDAFQDYQPEIAALADGGIAVSWRGNHYDVSGTTLDSRSYEQNVYVRAFDNDGTARGAEVSLGSIDRSYSLDNIDRHTDYIPKIAASEDGSFAVVWQGQYNNYSGTTYVGFSNDIFLQRFDADGVAQGSSVQVSQTESYQSNGRTNDAYRDNTPEIAALENGGYVVTWSGRHEEYNGSTFVSSTENIWARVYDADGQPVTGELSIGEVDTSYSPDDRDRAYDYNPKVAGTADGGFVVTWYGNYFAYSGTTAIENTREIYVQKFDENGDAVAAAQRISETGERTTGSYQLYDSIADSDPQITDLLGGGFVVTWYSDQQTYNGSTFVESARVVQAQRFDESGVAVGDLITLGNIVRDGNGTDRSQDNQARVTALNDGGFAIAWRNNTNIYDQNGAYQGNSNDVFVAAVHASGGGTELTDPVEVDVANLIDDADIPDGDQLTVTVATGSNGSTATVNGTVISLLPNAAYYAALGKDETEDETFTYTVTDLAGAQATATITLTITGNNDKPEANAISGAADEDGPATTLTADFTDVDTNDTHTYSVNTADTLGVVTNNGDGTFDYDPNGAFEALAVGETTTDTFKYTVRDAAGKSSTATATVTITGENDAPTAQAAAISNGYVYSETPETNQQKVSLTDQYQSGSQTRDANYDDQPRVVSFGDGGYAVAWRQRDETYSGSTRIDSEDQVAVQIFDADHNKVGGIQTFGEVDQSYSNDNLDRSYDNQISMTELDTGGFAMSWYGNYRSYTGTTLTRYERDIYVQIFDENGAPTSTDPIKVSETAYGTNGSNPNYDIFGDFEPAITSLVDGGIAVTWRTDEYGLSGTTLNSSTRDNQIKVQAYDTDGTARGSIVELGSIDRSYSRDSIDRHYEYEPRVAASDDGGFAVVWRGYYSDYSGTTTIGRDEDVYLQIFDADGVAQGGTTKVSQTVNYTSGSFVGDAHRDYEPEITALANGNYAVTWRGDHATYSGSTITASEQNIYVRVFDSSGQPVSQEVSVGSVGTSYSADDRDRHYDYNPEITATEDGGFVVAWYGDYYNYSGTTQTSYERDIWVQRFDEDGAALGSAEKVSQTVPRQSGSSDYDSFQDYRPVVTGLEGGGYVVVWESNQETFNGTTFVSSERLIQAQRFDVEGKKAGELIDLGRVSRDGNGYDRAYDSAPKVSALEGGGFAVTWQNSTDLYNSNGTYAGNERDVYVAAIQPIGNGSLADGVVVDVADKIGDIDLPGGDTLTVTVDAVGSNGSTATVNGTEITISPNLSLYAPLAKGETAEETFTYTVTDASGAQASATLTFTARGENDAPVVESVTYSALDSGTIAFSDVDNGDTHTVAATDATITGDASALAGIDVFDFIAFDAVDQAGDTVDWTINVPSAAQSAVAAALADGETLTIDYTVGVSDEEEDLAQTTVSITLDGDGFLI
ncbi:MAG: tandem-95 repeat protein [Cognatishimia activa]